MGPSESSVVLAEADSLASFPVLAECPASSEELLEVPLRLLLPFLQCQAVVLHH